MKNFNNFYKKVGSIADKKATETPKTASKGLASRGSPSPQKTATSDDVFNQVATYIDAIRKQKKELMNGRS